MPKFGSCYLSLTCLRKEKKMTTSLRSYDIPQVYRFGVGFDKVLNQIDEVLRINLQHNVNYPPFNMIQNDENNFTIEIAVSGFKQGEISITIKEYELCVEGKKDFSSDDTVHYLHRGISGRDFQRLFWINNQIVVKEARQENGILSIKLERVVPVEKQPKTIPITYVI